MLFHSLQYLALFGVAFTGYWLVQWWRLPRLVVLLGASVAFYAAWNPMPLVLFAGYAVVNHVAGLLLDRLQSERARKAVLVLAVGLQLGGLVTFKYLDLFLRTSGWLMRRLGYE